MRLVHILVSAVAGCLVASYNAPVLPAYADEEHHCHIDWNKLNLTPEQNQQVQQLNAQWEHDYGELKPAINEQQRKLTKLLADHNSDSIEIMALQQSLQRKQAELHARATANFLKKRQILNENQQCLLEAMVRQAVEQKQRSLSPQSQPEVWPDRIQYLIQKVRNIWPVQADR